VCVKGGWVIPDDFRRREMKSIIFGEVLIGEDKAEYEEITKQNEEKDNFRILENVFRPFATPGYLPCCPLLCKINLLKPSGNFTYHQV
jgi:hypothetical protein